MTFTYQWFTNGFALPALNLNEMYQNDVHVREEAAYKTLITASGFTADVHTAGWTWKPRIDGVDISAAATMSGTGDMAQGDIPLTGVTAGLHTLTVAGFTARFNKTADLAYISLWVTIKRTGDGESWSGYDWVVSNLTVIGHREIKTWA